MPPEQIRLTVRGKVNLGLSILGKRPDGYHDIESVAVLVGLADVMVVRPLQRGIRICCPGIPGPPEENLAWRAGCAALKLFPGLPGLDIRIDKGIPVGGGMGGASADAAAVLRAASMLQEGPGQIKTLYSVARSLGADVPMFLLEQTAGGTTAFLLQERGDEVTPLRLGLSHGLHLVLVVMNFPVSTAWAYVQWDEMVRDGHYRSRKEATPAPVRERVDTPPPAVEDSRVKTLLLAMRDGDINAIASSLFNDLEEPVFRSFPVLGQAKAVLRRAGALGAVMTGSGSTIIGVVSDLTHGTEVCREFRRLWTEERSFGSEKSSLSVGQPGVSELVLVDTNRVLGRWKFHES